MATFVIARLTFLEASRRKQDVSGWWYAMAVLLGPIFLCFILPLWIGKWGRGKGDVTRRPD